LCANSRDVDQSLLLALPGMLEASGAMLERLEIQIPADFVDVAGWLVPLAQAVRRCAPTLRALHITLTDVSIYSGEDGGARDILWSSCACIGRTC
jgi:hypothetical protein